MTLTVIPLAPSRRRTLNFTGKETCQRCRDDALVDVTENGREVCAPCPFCERGFRLEFGISRRNGVDVENPDGGPWGKEGLWRSRQPEQLGLEVDA